jgi:tetratricopeptide (TPR) repeat protein
LLLCHGLLILPFTGYLRQRPVEVKLGYLPHPQILKLSVADHGLAVAEVAVVKVLFYFGTLVEVFHKNVIFRPEYPNMYRTLQTAAQLDPYNMDNYYFAQAAFTWELGRIAEVNALLEQGMKYRTWDPWLPFYIGFNRAYFLKDYIGAAPFMQLAAERSGNPLFTKLASRYFYESRQTELGLIFLDSMIAQAKDKAVKATYQLRRDALLAVAEIERALSEFRKRQGRDPSDLHELVATGLLPALPADPYGGIFYLDADGRVRSTSKLADHER